MQSTWIPGDPRVGKTSIIHKSEKMQNRKRLENELKGSLFYFLINGKHKSPQQFGENLKVQIIRVNRSILEPLLG